METPGQAGQSREARAVVLRSLEEGPRLETVTIDPPRPGEVLVRVAASGVCGSDLHVLAGRSEAMTLPVTARPASAAFRVPLFGEAKPHRPRPRTHGVREPSPLRQTERSRRRLPSLPCGFSAEPSPTPTHRCPSGPVPPYP